MDNPFPSDLREAIALYQAGQITAAAEAFENCLLRYPDHLHVLHIYALFLSETKTYDRAIELLSQALILQPDDPQMLTSLGIACKEQGRWEEGVTVLKRALTLAPHLVEANTHLSEIFLNQNQPDLAIASLQQALAVAPQDVMTHFLLARAYEIQHRMVLSHLHAALSAHYLQPQTSGYVDNANHWDAFFLDGQQALETARQNHRLQQTIAVTGRQICYHLGERMADAPPHCIPVSPSNLVPFFKTTRLRPPHILIFDLRDPEQCALATEIAKLLDAIALYRKTEAYHQLSISKQLAPGVPAPGEPWRIFLPASRLTTVMQYCSAGLAESFRQAGCEVLLVREENDMEGHDLLHVQNAYNGFNPHIVVQINHINNDYLHDQVFNIIWFQDPMPAIRAKKPLYTRDRDIFFTMSNFEPLLDGCHIHNYQVQNQCVDNNIYKTYPDVVRSNKIVFAGTDPDNAFGHLLSSHPRVADDLFATLDAITDAARQITLSDLHGVAERHQIDFNPVVYDLFYYYVRKRAVHWICSAGPGMAEIYGTRWEKDAMVQPFYKGQLTHGEALARMYSSAKYALVPASNILHLQRLGEVAACGCIPVVFDVRAISRPPLWENEVLYFRNRQTLLESLHRQPPGDPAAIADYMSYDHFARDILEKVNAFQK